LVKEMSDTIHFLLVITEIAKATVSMSFLTRFPFHEEEGHPLLEIERCSSAIHARLCLLLQNAKKV
jgi:hypothetical protein